MYKRQGQGNGAGFGFGGDGSGRADGVGDGGSDDGDLGGGSTIGEGNRDGSTSQITRVPLGSAATGGGSTSGVENVPLLLIGLALVAASGPALALRRRFSDNA